MLLKLFRWLCGSLLLLLGGLAWVKAGPVGGALFFTAGLLVLPPTFPLLARATNTFLPRPLKWVAVVVACTAGIGALATELENQDQPTPQALAAERLARHVEDSLGIRHTPATQAAPLGPYRTYPGRGRRRPYYPSRTYQQGTTYRQPASAVATGPVASPRTYTYRTTGSAPVASPPQPYSGARIFSYRPGRQRAASPASRPQFSRPSRYSWKRSGRK